MLWSEPTGTANGRRRISKSATSRCSTKSNRRAWKERKRSGGEEMAIKIAIVVVVMACLAAGGTRASSESRPAQEKQEEAKGAKSQTTATPAQSAGEDQAYKIGPQDVLKID